MLIQQPIKMEGDSNLENMIKCEKQASPRRRKNGAFLKPNLIDVVGQPKYKVSEMSTNESESSELDIESAVKTDSCDYNGDCETDLFGDALNAKDSISYNDRNFIENNNGKLKEDYVRELDNLTNLLRSLIVKEFEVSPDEKLERSTESKTRPEITRKRSLSENEIRSDRAVAWKEEEKDHVMIELPLTPQKEKRTLKEDTSKLKRISRTRSLPNKSKFTNFLNFGKGRRSNSTNDGYVSSDGEGSGQSMMSFGSSSSSLSIGKRSRSGSLLSRSRTCSSPMSDKRSRAGSLLKSKSGCPQYFIPGENRGRLFMEPLDLFQTQTVCIKGISFKIMKDMPRTHRAMSMIGCMGFIVPAPSKYFER